ncbi:MAG TPA: ubiquitin-like domain-containing protein [Candidatus Baltobacteraceae bacterium]|nr:ubiquitin-like domain-containing protein [Candidatus Baltobacteraceae bacterium]
MAQIADPVPAKHIIFVHDGRSEPLDTRAATVGDLLTEQSVVPGPDDAVIPEPATALQDGETVTYRAAVPVTVVVDGVPRTVRSSAACVADLLADQHVRWDAHDRVSPAAFSSLSANGTIQVRHVERWTETVREPIPPRVVKRYALALPLGKSKVVSAGRPGLAAVSYEVSRTGYGNALRRSRLVSRVLRAPHDKIVAEGIGEYTALSALARRGIAGTLRLATSALSMVATAYSAASAGGSGMTAIGRPAGHGIVAVDPAVIPLGTHLFIPGYGHAVAGDTGGAIRGNRIDLGFQSTSAADAFGRRSVMVYVFK